MKKIYSIVLMAAMLLVGTNAWATTHEVANANALENAWKNAASGDVIQLTSSFTFDKILWLGTTNMSDAAKSLTLDLNGCKLTQASGMKYFILITHGDLNIISSLPGGAIWGNESGNEEVIRLTGSTYRTLDPKTAESGYFTHLTIGSNVGIRSQKQNAVVVDVIDNTTRTVNSQNVWIFKDNTAAGVGANSTGAVPAALPYSAKVYNSSYGVANGVRVDVYGTIHGKKYAMKTNGNLGSPSTAKLYDASTLASKQFVANPNPLTYYTSIEATDVNYSPFVRIYGSARLETDVVKDGDYEATDKKPVALYASGYARWLIEGTCEGATAVYVKSGQLDIHDATITSNYEGTFQASSTPQTGSGVLGVGSAIVMQSNDAYAGDIDVTVSGDTKVEASNGYAVEEAVISKADTTKVDAITITGGTFEGGKVGGTEENPIYGTISISEETNNAKNDDEKQVTVSVGAANINGTVTVGDNDTTALSEIVDPAASHTTIVTDENGKQTVVISAGPEIPASEKDKESVHDQTGNVNWKHNDASEAAMVDTIKTEDVTLDELVINQTYDQTLVINANRKLTAKHIVLGGKAQIIVEAGAKLIVTGDQGIATTSNKNIILRTQEGNPSMFLIKPVANGTNKHPRATVEFVSKSFTNSSTDYFYQRFGIPANGQLSLITARNSKTQAAVETAFISWVNYAWTNIGFIHSSKTPLDYSKMAEPFVFYQMQHNAPYSNESYTIVTMEGELVGNESPNLAVLGDDWSTLANSYMGTIDAEQLINLIPTTVDKCFYLYNVNADQASWYECSLLDMVDIQPMQPFLIRNTQAAANVELNYADAVYNPAIAKAAGAPARRSAVNDITKAKMTVKGADGVDKVVVAEGEQFSAAFDNGYDVVKYMNEGIKMYVSADEKMGIFATDNLENTYVGFQTINGGVYTIEFTDVQGAELTLVDHETGARVAMVEGNTYEFTAAANSVNDYRFEIVESAKLPTAIDNTEAVKSAKGIYTVTGQYLGEMNVWNTLPAGVYVINGEKRVK